MGFNAGSINADSGMSKYIYEAMEAQLSAAFDGGPSAEVITGWKKFSYCMALGFINYMKTDIGISGITVVDDGTNKHINFQFTNGGSRNL